MALVRDAPALKTIVDPSALAAATPPTDVVESSVTTPAACVQTESVPAPELCERLVQRNTTLAETRAPKLAPASPAVTSVVGGPPATGAALTAVSVT